VGSMLILLALGTDSRVLRKDYMMTNAYRWTAVQRFLDRNKELFKEHQEAEEALVAYEGVREEAIDIVINTILSRYSSIDAYLEAEFGLDDMARMKLQEMYLE
ncbi:MAG: tyrosine-protein phosphatase, partial [Solobacterium sp.]|nr:tyrosine-protein phosphatase [Solobacterium sp.]